MLYRSKLLHDILNEFLEPRCTISSRDVQVLFVGRDLYIQKRNDCSVFFFQHDRKNQPPTFSICKMNNLF